MLINLVGILYSLEFKSVFLQQKFYSRTISRLPKSIFSTKQTKTWGYKSATFATNSVSHKIIETFNPSTTAGDQPTFYRRVKSRMIAQNVKGSLKMPDWDTLHNDSKQVGIKWRDQR